MILQLNLEHTKTMQRQTLDIWDVDAAKIAALSQAPGAKLLIQDNKGGVKKVNRSLESYISELVVKKLPQAFYNFRVVDWELKDHSFNNGR